MRLQVLVNRVSVEWLQSQGRTSCTDIGLKFVLFEDELIIRVLNIGQVEIGLGNQ
jgi:hypothetical protein